MATLNFSGVFYSSSTCETMTVERVKCKVSTVQTTEGVHFKSAFEWNQGFNSIDGYEGYLYIKCTFKGDERSYCNGTFVDINGSGDSVEVVVPMNGASEKEMKGLDYEFSLRPFSVSRDLEPLMAANFAATEHTDANLIVEGKKIPVNKALLCHHSRFFRDLFTARTTRSDCEDVPIESESFTAFVRFLSMIHQHPYFPNDHTAHRMLELAKRYDVPSVTKQVGHLLARDIQLPKFDLLYLSKKYELKDVERKVFGEIKTYDIINIRHSRFYDLLSDSTKLEMFDVVLKLISIDSFLCTYYLILLLNCRYQLSE